MTRLSKFEVYELSKRIVHFYETAGERDCKNTKEHFAKEGVSASTTRNILDRYLKENRTVYRDRTGRPPTVATPKLEAKIRSIFTNDPGLSVRNAASRVGASKSTVGRLKLLKLGFRARKKKKAPKYKGDQAERAKKGCREIYRKILPSGESKILIIDDETYLHIDPQQNAGVSYYHESPDAPVSDIHRFQHKEKFAGKYLVWQAMDELGNVSEPFISTGTITMEVYRSECLEKRLLPFIEKHHQKEEVLFWPDMASAHYGQVAVAWYEENGIDYVHRNENAPNVPQARPIERFWALCKAAYRKRKKVPKTLQYFRTVWKKLAKEVAQRSGATLMKKLRGRLRAIAYGGVYAVLR